MEEMWRTGPLCLRSHLKAMLSSSQFRPSPFLYIESLSPFRKCSSIVRPCCHSFPSTHRSLSSEASSVRAVLPAIPCDHRLQMEESGPLIGGNDGVQQQLLEVEQEEHSRVIPVKAFFLCTSIDLRGLQHQNAFNVVPPNSRATNYIVLRYSDLKENYGLEASFGSGNNCSYMVVFQYGSVVLFNISDEEVDGYLKIIQKHASGLLPEMRKDDYDVVEKPTLQAWMQGGLDHIMLKNLNIDGIRTIGSVLGQSIALDHYICQVDGMVAEFTGINREMEKTGTFTMTRKKLFQLIGKANSNLADVILKLGLFERSDIAWRNANYAEIWEYLREEYELTQRFGSLDYKLKFVEHNIRFLLEILQNKKSDFLEWLIILLISGELLISVYDIIR